MITMNSRLSQIKDDVDRFQNHYEAWVATSKPHDLRSVEKLLGDIERCNRELLTLVTPKTKNRHLSTQERIASLVAALDALAKSKGGILAKPDTLHSFVCQYAPQADRNYWAGDRQGEIYGMIRSQPEVRELLEQSGVLAWVLIEDRRTRLVNTNWLTSHAEIRRFVTDQWPGGRRCRFCRIDEVPATRALVAVDPERRKGYTTVNGVVSLQPGQIHVHAQCTPHWQRWLAIAESYPDQAAAEAADRAAGRASASACPPMPNAPEPERLAPPESAEREARTPEEQP